MPLNSVDLKAHAAPGTAKHKAIGILLFVLFGPLLLLFFTLVTYGIGPIIWFVVSITRTKKARAQLHGSAVKVSARQFPDIHRSVLEMSRALGLTTAPDVYILEDNTQNAFAIKHGKQGYVVLIDDVVHGAISTGNPEALRWIVAHELAHHALGHTGWMHRTISSKYLPLARLDEDSCDRVAHALLNDPTATRDALALLIIGPHLYSRIDRAALEQQAREVAADKHTKKAERTMSHPLLLSRYASLLPLMPKLAPKTLSTETRLPIAAAPMITHPRPPEVESV